MGNRASTPASTVVIENDDAAGGASVAFTPDFLRSFGGLPSAESVDRQQRDRSYAEQYFLQRRLAEEKRDLQRATAEIDALVARQKPLPQRVVDPKIRELEQAVVQCYRDQSGRPLDCWQEVEALKKAVKQAQHAFIASH